MVGAAERRWMGGALAGAALLLVLVLGVKVRLADPLSTPVVPAEDPYNHMALVREHLRDGRLDALNEGSSLYPPGMHAFLAAAWVFTGIDLYEITRLGPVVFGALSILGVALLLARFDGTVAAVVGALAAAVAPEAVFRTTMMAPTALDLALLPFLLYALLEVIHGRFAFAGVAAPAAAFLVYAHPWILSVVALAGFLYVVFAVLFPWRAPNSPPVSPFGVATSVAIVGVAWAFALGGCWGYCQGNPDTLSGGRRLADLAPLILLGSLVPFILAVYAPRSLQWLAPAPGRKPRPLLLSVMGSAAIAVLGAYATMPALDQGLPTFVNLPRMFGWPILAMAVLGLLALPFHPNPANQVGAAIAAATYPFVFYNPLHSTFLSHRTVIYLGVGIFLLAGTAAGLLARLATRAFLALSRRPTQRPAPRPAFALVAVTLVAGSLAGSIYVATPEPDRWYRLFSTCEFDTLEQIAAHTAKTPDAIVITGDWQAKLVLAGITDGNASRIWYKGDFFTSKTERQNVMNMRVPLVAVVDQYLKPENPGADTGFLNSAPWERLAASCSAPKTQEPGVIAYITTGAGA